MNIKALNLASLSIEDLTRLRDETGRVLAGKLESEKRKLERQLARLGTDLLPKRAQMAARQRTIRSSRKAGRAYPPVRPKYRNPANRSETWAGRGKQPRWLVAQLKGGKKIEDFLIQPKTTQRATRRAG